MDEQNELENFLEHKDTEMWRKRVEGERKPADSVDQEKLYDTVLIPDQGILITGGSYGMYGSGQ